MTQTDKLRMLLEIRDPALRAQRLLTEQSVNNLLRGMQLTKGDDGKTPVKGVDYFTPQEIEELIRIILDRLPDVQDGYTPVKGIDYHTPADIAEIVSQVRSQVKDGETPELGVDYFTPEHKKSIVQEVLRQMPPIKPPKVPTTEEIAQELRKQPLSYSDLKDAPDLTDLPKLIEFLKRGGFRGGGGGGSGTVAIVYTETPSAPSPVIDGVNKTYTTLHTISNVYSFAINGEFLHPAEYSVSGTTITMVTALDASLSGLPFTITYS